MKRSANAVAAFGATVISAVAIAAAAVLHAKRRRADQRSESARALETNAPVTNPSCTLTVSQAAPVGDSDQAWVSVPDTADALNHGAIAHNSANDRTPRTRRGVTCPSGGRERRW